METVDLSVSYEGESRVSFPKHHEWFHSTRNADWFKSVNVADIHVHVGDSESSWDRMASDIYRTSDELPEYFYLWTLGLKEEATIHEEFMADFDDDNVFTKNVVTIYHNRWEAPGSIALYLPARFLTPIDCRIVTVEEVEECGSVYSISM